MGIGPTSVVTFNVSLDLVAAKHCLFAQKRFWVVCKFLDDENLCFDRDETDLHFKTVQIANQMALLNKGFVVPQC